jgi:hypothetical protein
LILNDRIGEFSKLAGRMESPSEKGGITAYRGANRG